MPRNGSGVYSLPATYEAVTGEIATAEQHNDPLEDIEQVLNDPLPIVAGGTGADTAVEANDAIHTKGSNIASATTTDLSAATGDYVHITGTTTITGFGTAAAGVQRTLVFDAALNLTHNATSLILPGATSLTTAAGDTAIFRSEGSGNWRCIEYQDSAGQNLYSADAGAGSGPQLSLIRASATPAANDVIGVVSFIGKDSAGNNTAYGNIYGSISDATNTSEDGSVTVQTIIAGTGTNNTTFIGTANLFEGGATDFTLLRDTDTRQLTIRGGNNSATTAYLRLHGGSHASEANNYQFTCANVDRYKYDHSVTQHRFTGDATVSGSTRFGQNTTDGPGNGNNTQGASLLNTGQLHCSVAGGVAGIFNRTADGGIVSLNSGGVQQGLISIAGATTTYAAFFGSHWSQPKIAGEIPQCMRGMIVESVAEMCSWEGEGKEERLPKFVISRTAGSKKVYGVFAWWDEDGDAFIGAIGAYVIRVQKGETVEIGDLIESAGNGFGRVQADDIFRSSTVAKITSTEVVEKFKDGSKLYPCTLHSG